MRKKSKTYQKKSFESIGTSSDTSANLYESMMQSEAWIDLTPSQKVLYVVCKGQYYGQPDREKLNGDRTTFTMNRDKWLNRYKLYKENNARAFYRDMSALIMHGFIVVAEKYHHQKTIYRFSDNWQNYGTERFRPITPSEMNDTLRREFEFKQKIRSKSAPPENT